MNETDLDLLNRYTRQHAEDAFAELVRRHLNLVYSVALRQVRSPQLAEEVAQSTFTDLARNTHRLAPDTILTAWLYQVARRSAIDVVRREAGRQLREQIATEMNAANANDADWSHIEPLLDEAMDALDKTDRAAVLLRYFENKTLCEVGQTLGTSEDAAQKRVSRAVERLREYFTKHGIRVGAGGLVVLITANAVEAAPAGLAAGISSAALAPAAAGVVQGAALSASTLTSVKAAIHIMSATKISVAIGLAAATVIALEWQQVSIQKQTVKELEAQVAQDAQASRAQQSAIEKLQERNAFYARTMESGARDVAKARARLSAALKAKPDASSARATGAKIDLTPAMRDQLSTQIREKYAPLVKHLNLSLEQADQFYQTLVDYKIKKLEDLQNDETGNIVKVEVGMPSLQTNLQSVLGDASTAQFWEFETKTLPDQEARTKADEVFQNNPLTDAQLHQLTQAERSTMQSIMQSLSDSPAGIVLNQTATKSQSIQLLDQMNQSVLQQAAAFLSSDQLQTLATYQSNGLAAAAAATPSDAVSAFLNNP